MKKSLIQKLGLLGVFSFLSYTAAVVFAPLAYPGYNWMAQAVTALVVLLSIVSLAIIIAAGAKKKDCRSYGVCAGIALGMMLVGAVGMKLVPAEYFGVVERFSVFAATGFNAALGLHLFCTKPEESKEKTYEK